MRGQHGSARATMQDKPTKISLYDNFEALIRLKN